MESSLQVVHLRINDAGTGQPTPVWLRVTDKSGTYFPPLGRAGSVSVAHGGGPFQGAELVESGALWSAIPGSCEMLLPAGRLSVQFRKGPDYLPGHEQLERRAGKISFRFQIERRPERPTGWRSGDLLVRRMTPAAAALAGAAAGLDFVHLVAEQSEDGSVQLLDEYSGEAPALTRHGCTVQVGTHNQGGEQGSLVLLNTHRVVFPLRLGEPGFSHYQLSDWIGQAKRKKGMALFVVHQPSDLDLAARHSELDGVVLTGRVTLPSPFPLPVLGGSNREDVSGCAGRCRTVWPAELSLGEAIRLRQVKAVLVDF